MRQFSLWIFILFFSSAGNLFSQGKRNPFKDSLEKRIQNFPKRDTLRADALIRLGNILYGGQDVQRCFELVKEAQKICDSLNFKKGIIGCLIFYGQHYSQHGDYSKALELDLQAYKIAVEINAANEVVRLQRNIGTAYHNTHQYDLALKYYVSALEGANKLQMKNDIAGLENNIGIVYHMQKNYDKALEYYQLSLKTCEEFKNTRTKSYVFNSIGRMYMDKGLLTKSEVDLKTAIEYFEKSLALKREMNDHRGMANAYGNIGEVYKQQNNLTEALKFMKLGEEQAVETDYQDWLREGYGGMAEIYEHIGDFKNAYEYHKKFLKIRDTLENAEIKERMTRMQGMFDTEQKDNEIQLLHKEQELNTIKDSRKTTLLWGAGIALLCVVILLFFIFRGYSEKKKANAIISLQKNEVEAQKKIVDHKNNEMLDSIRYAKHIQEAILPTGNTTNILGENFILYKPKDIVSGDFYWMEEFKDLILLVAADCTGHGVPGAFVSFVGHSNLVRCVNEFGLTDPGKILDKLNLLVNDTLRQRRNESTVRDGMDVSMIVMDKRNKKLFFAGANNPIYIIRDGILTETKGNKQPVGNFLEDQSKPFTTHEFNLKAGDQIYIFTDGMADQFGGPKGKKFKYTQFKEILTANSNSPMSEQKNQLNFAFEKWKGELEQVDDVCVIGIRI